jgi:hypothetical protein
MNCYVVRIYREEANNPHALIGIVEEVEKPGKQSFSNLDELWTILNPAGKQTENKKDKQGARGNSATSRDAQRNRKSRKEKPKRTK